MPLDVFDDGSQQPLEPVRLPFDEIAHKHTMEWWYFVAHLQAVSTDDQVTLLMSAIRRDFGPNASVGLMKITDHKLGSWPLAQSGQRFDKAYRGMSNPVHYRMKFGPGFHNFFSADGNWEVEGRPGRYRIAGSVSDGEKDAQIDLTFRSTHAAVKLCGDGIMDYGLGHRLAYYLRPKVEVSGRMDVGGIIQRVTGKGWYERQWGPWPEQTFSWKYLNIHLDDGEQLLVFHSILDSTTHRHYVARFPHQGGIREYDPTRDQILHFSAGGRLSETEVRLDTDEGPLILQIIPMFPDEPPLDARYPGVPTFWETVSRVEGTRGGVPVKGLAMTELHDYE